MRTKILPPTELTSVWTAAVETLFVIILFRFLLFHDGRFGWWGGRRRVGIKRGGRTGGSTGWSW